MEAVTVEVTESDTRLQFVVPDLGTAAIVELPLVDAEPAR
jgi:hypothetical protein